MTKEQLINKFKSVSSEEQLTEIFLSLPKCNCDGISLNEIIMLSLVHVPTSIMIERALKDAIVEIKNSKKTKPSSTSNKSLYKEYLNASEYINYNDIYAKSEIPLKTQLQSLLANLPDEAQLEKFEGDIRTLQTTMQAMNFESKSMSSNVENIKDDVLTIRNRLRSVTSRIEQLIRDMSLTKPDNDVLNKRDGGTIESSSPYDTEYRK